MFTATCSRCGKECRLPFRPTGARPVFCSDCFQQNRESSGGGDSRGDFRRDARRPETRVSEGPSYREQFEAINAKLDKILSMLPPAELTMVTSEEKTVEQEEAKPVKKTRKTAKKTVTSEE
jgi:CxxC-x17-CxxC domain-containing protein